jgi:hypothetical protein
MTVEMVHYNEYILNRQFVYYQYMSPHINKILFLTVAITTIIISPRLALAKSNIPGGYLSGFAGGVVEANEAITQLYNGSLKSIGADKPQSCPLADKQDDYCDGWKDGWATRILDILG